MFMKLWWYVIKLVSKKLNTPFIVTLHVVHNHATIVVMAVASSVDLRRTRMLV